MQMMAPHIQRLEQALAPVQHRSDQAAADAELKELDTKYPGWNKRVNSRDLGKMLQLAPHLPVESAYHILAGPKLHAELSSRNGDMQRMVARTPPAAVPSRHAPVTRSKVDGFDSAWARTMRIVDGEEQP